MYNEKVMELFRNPKNAGAIRGANAVGKAGNHACGDIIKIYMNVDKNDVITEASFKTFGCVSAIAASDITCDLVRGKTIEKALKVTNKDVVDALGGLPAQKMHCSVLAKEAIEDAVKMYRKSLAKPKKKK